MRVIPRFRPNPLSLSPVEDFLYHVTYFNRLESIAEDGLQANRRRSIGAASYDAHARGRIFLTEGRGVFFWYGRAEAFAETESEDILEDGLVPVVLRVLLDDLTDDELEPDDLGTRDTLTDAWIAKDPIDPDALEVWTGRAWAPVSHYEEIDSASAVKNIATPEEEEDGPIWVFQDRSPLIPPELQP